TGPRAAERTRAERRPWRGAGTPLRQFGISAAIIVAIIVVIFAATSGRSKKGSPKPNSTQRERMGAEVSSLLAGIPQRGNTLGDPNAPGGGQYFADLTC